jgi:hypothetical protein
VSTLSVNRKEVLANKKEHALRSDVHLHQDIGHIRENHLQAMLLPEVETEEASVQFSVATSHSLPA